MNRIAHLATLVLLACLGLGATAPVARGEEDPSSYRINLKDADIGEFITQVARITGRNWTGIGVNWSPSSPLACRI